MKVFPRTFSYSRSGFTLLELLVVMAILAFLASIIVPSFNNLTRGTALSRAGQELGDTFSLARQEAVARNRQVEFRFIQIPGGMDGAKRYRAVQAWAKRNDADANFSVPLSKATIFPNGIVIAESATLSPLVQPSLTTSGTTIVGGASCNSRMFRILANGGLTSALSGTTSFLTLIQEKDVASTSVPTNFFSIYINPITGEVSTYQP